MTLYIKGEGWNENKLQKKCKKAPPGGIGLYKSQIWQAPFLCHAFLMEIKKGRILITRLQAMFIGSNSTFHYRRHGEMKLIKDLGKLKYVTSKVD